MAEDTEDWFERALEEHDEQTEGGQTDTSDAAGGSETDEPSDSMAPQESDATDESRLDPGGDTFGFDIDPDSAPEDDFGFDMGQESTGFDEETYQTDISRINVGIEGLDEMIQGGIPERSLLVAIGGPGTGKTTFGLQFVHEALENDEQAVYIALDESKERIIESGREKGWAFDEYVSSGELAVVDMDPVDMANSLASIRNELPELIETFGASRITIDSVSLLEMMYDDQATRRTEIYDFARSLKQAGVTTMLTSESDDQNPFVSRYSVIEYLTDAVFILRYVRPEDFQETRMAIEIQKIRDANHSRETKPYEITSTGISVYRQANIF